MARKTAMKKDPTVSIAVPQSEKDRLRGLKPGGPSMANGVAQGKPGPLKRLSPGVYRSSSGQLVGSKGQALPGQPSMKDKARNVANIVSGGQGMGDGRDRARQGGLVEAMNQAPQQGQIATRPPAPLGTPPGVGMQQAAEQGQQGPAPLGNMMPQMPQMQQPDMNQFNESFAYEQRQRPNSISGLLQRGGQQQQPMMQNPQMNMPMPELSFEQWKQMQMGQNGYGGQMPQQQYGQPQNMNPNGMAIGPGGQQMTVQQLEQMKAQNLNRFGSIS